MSTIRKIQILIYVLLSCFAVATGAVAGSSWTISIKNTLAGTVYTTGASYKSKQEAVAAMRSMSIPWAQAASILTQESVSTMDAVSVTYKYTAPVRPPLFVDDYRYGWSLSTIFYPSESDAVISRISSASCSPNDATYVAFGAPIPQGAWTTIEASPGSITQSKPYQSVAYTAGAPYFSCATEVLGSFITMYREQGVECPAAYPINIPNCASYYVGYVTGPLLECSLPPSGAPVVGDPCDVSTGDFFQNESDFWGAGLRFDRVYHSAALSYNQPLGMGWTHNYSGRLIITNGIPSGMVGSDGHQDAIKQLGGNFVTLSGTNVHVLQSGTGWIALLGDGSSETYDITGLLTEERTPGGALTSLTYNTAGQLSTVSDAYGHSLQFSYNADGTLQRLTQPGGQVVSYAYDVNGNLRSVSYPDATSRTYLYEVPGLPNNLSGIVDETGARFLTVGYDPDSSAVTSSSQAGGANAVSIAYNSGSAVVTDALGSVTTYNFTTDQNYAPRVTSAIQNSLTLSYAVPAGATDPRRRVTRTTDPNGNVTTFSYDSEHLTSMTEAYGTPRARTTSYSYLATTSALPVSVTEALRTTSFTYFSGTNLVQTKTIVDTATGSSRSWNYTYDGDGRILTEKGPRTDVNSITTYAYNACISGYECGQLASLTDPVGNTTVYNTYDSNGRPLTITDANGVVSTLTYDLRERLTSRTVGGETTTFSYWPTGLTKRITLPDASYVQYTYDGAGRLIRVNDAAGNSVSYTLDAMGNRTAENYFDESNVLHRLHTRVYNSLNQLYKDLNAAGTAAVTTTLAYDSNGNLISATAPLARTTSNAYDELNRLKQTTDPANGVTQFTYDANDNPASVVDARSLTTSYTYNGLGNLTHQVSPDTGASTITYDSAGNISAATDARGALATYAYDASNRVVSTSYSVNGVTDQSVLFVYDGGANGKGRLTGASDGNHSLSWAYDALGRVTIRTQTVGSQSMTVGYGYANGNLTSLTTPGGRLVTYGYNGNHQVSSVAINGISVLGSVEYEPSGAIAGWTWGNGTGTSRTYDTDGNISSISSAGAKSYTYDDASRVIGVSNSADGNLSWIYGYDTLDRLSSGSTAGQSQLLTYDATGNRLTQTGLTPTTLNISATSNRMTGASGGISRTYSYDSTGNVTSYGGMSFTYNGAGRLSSTISSGVTTSYLYNALGQRVKKTSGSLVTYFAYDEAGHLLGEYDGTGTPIEEIIWLGNIPVATARLEPCGLSIFYIHTDHSNTPRSISRRSTTQLVWSWESDPFGATTPNENPSGLGTFSFNLRFPGQYYDVETGLYQNMARDYDPATGRYIESDPIGLNGGINTYSYALGNPVSFVDPSGREVTLTCRPLSGLAAIGITPIKHCGVVVWHWSKECPRKKIIDAQYSLPGYQQSPTRNPNDPTYTNDRNAFNNPGGPNANYNIPVPPGMTQSQFDLAVRSQGTIYALPEDYGLTGPNSNTAASDIIRNAGGSVPNVPGAPGQNWQPPIFRFAN